MVTLDEVEEILFLIKESQLIILKIVREREKSPLEQYSNNCNRQDPSMHVKIIGQNFREKNDICIVSNIFSQIFINYKEKKSNFPVEETGRHLLNQANITIVNSSQYHIPPIWYNEDTLPLWHLSQ